MRGTETMTLTLINVSVDGKETWERPLTGWYYHSLPAGDSMSEHLPYNIWLSVQNLLRSMNPTSILFQMGSNFRRLEHGLPVNIYSHRKPRLESILSQMYVLLFMFVHVLPLDIVGSSSSVRAILETHEKWNQTFCNIPQRNCLSFLVAMYTISIYLICFLCQLFLYSPENACTYKQQKCSRTTFLSSLCVCIISHAI